MGAGRVIARVGGVVSGLEAMPLLVEVFAPACRHDVHARDGARVEPGTVVATIHGPLDELLGLERTLLNLVGRLSGIATRTTEFVGAIPPGSRARLYDTRKTTPGLRALEKYAVRCGGGCSHRMGLHDAMLIKDNHLTGVGVRDLPAFVTRAAELARRNAEPTFVEVEVDTLDQYEALLTLPAGVVDIVLLDNMTCEQMRAAAGRRDTVRPELELEASGGVTLAKMPEIAATGVDRISVGGLTHAAVSLDVALDVDG
jgi:nicotinate-nucleotide pyrophosphorylase (carboxylating)